MQSKSEKIILGHKIKRLRQNLNISQLEMAQELNISASYLNLIENNQRPITVNLLFKLGQLYNIQLLTDRYYDLLAADMEQKRTEKLAKFGIGGTASFFLIILSVVVYRQKRMKITLARELHELELHSEV